MLDLIDKLNKVQIIMFIEKNYLDKNIENLIKELKNKDIDAISNASNDYVDLIKNPVIDLRVITEICETKKISQNKKDFIQLGKYLKEVADELIKIGESN